MHSLLGVSANDCQKIGGLETRAANEGAIHMGQGQELAGVLRLDRAAVEDADAGSRRSEAPLEVLADGGVYGRDVLEARC